MLPTSFKSIGLWVHEKKRKIHFQGGHLGFPIGTIFFFFFIYMSSQCFLPSFESTGLTVQKKRKIDFPIDTILANFDLQVSQMRCGAVVMRRTRDREVPGSIPTNCKCCFLEQETLSTLLSTGFYPGKKRATWKISTRLLNVLPSINKVDYYYYYYYYYYYASYLV